jgi:hypothetical protein
MGTLGNPLSECQRKLKAFEKQQDKKTIQFLQIEAENAKLKAEVEATKTRADATWNMYLGILMQAGTISEARRWTATIYADLVELTERPHTKADVQALLESHGLNMKIQVTEIGRDEQGAIYDMRRLND